MGRSKKKFVALSILTGFFLAALVGEVSLRMVERFTVLRFRALANRYAENFFFHHNRDRELEVRPNFDPLLGWKAGGHWKTPIGMTVNHSGWRNNFEFGEKGKQIRVGLIGDSFTLGLGIADDETIAVQLQKELGSDFEVFNLGAAGWGIDQMAVMATQVAPKLELDMAIMGFISDDLQRSCRAFAWGSAPKPYFVSGPMGLELKGVPIQSHIERRKERDRFTVRLIDGALATIGASRFLNLIAAPLVGTSEKSCIETLNAEILKMVQDKYSERVEFALFHLYGKLPEGFEANLKTNNVMWRSLVEDIQKRSIQLDTPIGTSDGYHPDVSQAKVIASLYSDEVNKRLELIRLRRGSAVAHR